MKTTAQLRGMMLDNQSIENIFIVNGFDLISGSNKTNAATIFMPLKPWEDRNQTASQLVQSTGHPRPGSYRRL